MPGLHEISIGIILEEKHFVSRHQITKQEQERNCMCFSYVQMRLMNLVIKTDSKTVMQLMSVETDFYNCFSNSHNGWEIRGENPGK